MTYRELISMYKDGRLDDADRARVAGDIERQEAISEYLFDEEVPELTDIGGTKETPQASEAADAGDFTAMVRKTIRRAFLKMGIIVGAVLIAVLLLIQFVLPGAVSGMYYQPDKKVGDINQMTLDMSVYSETFMPMHKVDNVTVTSHGYGKYDVDMSQSAYVSGTGRVNVSGTVTRNSLRLFKPGALATTAYRSYWGCSDWDTGKTMKQNIDAANRNKKNGSGYIDYRESRKEALDNIKALPESDKSYAVFVDLNKIMKYGDLKKQFPEEEVWLAVQTSEKITQEIGFTDSGYGAALFADNKDYPLLTTGDIYSFSKKHGRELAEKEWETHFTSMIRYLSGQNEFQAMMSNQISQKKADSYCSYVRKHGLRVYGFAAVMTRSEMLSLMKNSNVYSLEIDDYQ